MPKAIISDIDDTLIHAGQLMENIYEYIQTLDGALILVTGRPESSRDDTTSELDDLNVVYSRLIMNDGSPADSNAFKKATAEELLKTFDVVLAIENNPDARAGYESLGITTLDPADIPEAGDLPTDPMIDEPANRWLRAANAIKTKIEPPRQAIIPEERASKLETRAHSLDAELRAEMSGDKLKLTGYAAVFNSRSEDLGGFTEVIAPGAFRKSLQSRNDIKLLWNHDTSSPLASTRAGTLRLIEDAKGLRVEADLAPTTLGKDISILVQRGDVSAFSFGFNVIKDSWSNSGTERTLEAVRLFEASLVSFPAYSATSGTATVRALDVDQLAAGLLALENGDNLEPDVARVLKSTIDKLVIQPDAPLDDGLIALKKKKLDLMLMEAE
jgi:HK97 family phage prohead protease